MGQYSLLDFNDLCLQQKQTIPCPPSDLSYVEYNDDQLIHQHEPYGCNSNLNTFSLGFSINHNYHNIAENREDNISISFKGGNTVGNSSNSSINGDIQTVDDKNTVKHDTHITHCMVKQEFDLMPVGYGKPNILF